MNGKEGSNPAPGAELAAAHQVERAQPGEESFVLAATAVALALDELGKMHALEQLPAPATLLARLETRTSDFNLLVGVARIYLRAQAVPRG